MLTHYYTLQYLHIMHISISKTMYRISFDKYVYASVEAKQQHLNTNIREGK